MKKILLFSSLILLLLFSTSCQKQPTYLQPHITDLACDTETNCPEGLECWNLDGTSSCVDPDPCKWYCGGADNCQVLESFPPQIQCPTGL
ncbi:MAG: hypothetical protein WC595_05755 [Candidatus Nanoarchaeia archaeon]